MANVNLIIDALLKHKTDEMIANTLNIIVVGKSGVGKSSFLNYLIGKEIFQTGIGEPVTQTYFDKREMPANEDGVKYVLYDTKGIEPTTTQECQTKIIEKINECDKKSNYFEWIHSIYYCFDATAGRIEPFEYNFIISMSKQLSVIVLLTKSDKVGQDKIELLTEEIHLRTNPGVLVIPVCSIETKGTFKNPTPTLPYGREDVLSASFYGLYNKVATIVPQKSVENLQKLIQSIEPLSTEAIVEMGYKESGRKMISLEWKEPNIEILKRIQDELNRANSNSSKELFDNVLEFYKKVNKFTPQVLFLTEATSAFHELKNFDVDIAIYNVWFRIKKMNETKQKLDNCVIFYDNELDSYNDAIEEYKSTIKRIRVKLTDCVDKYLRIYKGELLQYGKLCINNVHEESSTFYSVVDLSRDENIYAKLLSYALENGGISNDERRLLNKLREEFKITEEKAQKIEIFLKK